MLAPRGRVADDLGDAGAPPILRVVVRERDHVALLRDVRIATFLLRIDLVRGGGVRRSDEARPNPRGARDRALGHRDLEIPEHSGRGEIGMAEGVVADLEAIPVEVGDHTRVLDDVLPDGEEGRRHAQPPERVCDLRGPVGVGPVVEGEGDALSDPLLAWDQPAVGAGDPQGRVRFQRPGPVRGRGRRRSARAGAVHREALREQQRDQRADEQAEHEPVGGRPLDFARESAPAFALRSAESGALDCHAGPARAAGRALRCRWADSQVSRSAPRSSWSCRGSSRAACSRCSAIERAVARWPSDLSLANGSCHCRCRCRCHWRCHWRCRWRCRCRPARERRSSPPERSDGIEDGIEQAPGPGGSGSWSWPRTGASSGSWASRAAIRIRPRPQGQARSAMQRAAPRRPRWQPSADAGERPRSRRRSLRSHVAPCVDPYGLLGARAEAPFWFG